MNPVERPELLTGYVRHGRWLIPAQDPAVTRFYMDHLFIPRSRKEFFWNAIYRGPAILNPRHGGLGSERALRQLRKIAATNQGSTVAGCAELERKCDPQLLVALEKELVRSGQKIEGPLIPLFLGRRVGSLRPHVVLFLFGQGSHRPCAVAKIAEQERQSRALAHEFETIAAVHSASGGNARCASPAPISLSRLDGLTVLLETFVSGRTMHFETRSSLRPGSIISHHFERAINWLVEFQKVTLVQNEGLAEQNVHEHIVRPLEAFLKCCGPSANEQAQVRDVISSSFRLCGERIPLVARQGDFWSNNLILGEGTLTAVDWEQYQERSMPFHDLLTFLTSYGLLYPWKLGAWAEPAVALPATYVAGSRLAGSVRECLLSYCGKLGVSPGFLDIFFFVFLAERALEEAHNFRDDAPNRPRTWRELFRCYTELCGSVSFVWQH